MNGLLRLVAAAGVVGAALLVVGFFEQVPQAWIDSRTLAIDWSDLHSALRASWACGYCAPALRLPPWNLLLLMPVGLLPMRASWGLLVFGTLGVLLVSVPRARGRGRYLLAVLLLVLSFPALRHAADGNFEGIVIGGVLLALWGFRAGLGSAPTRSAPTRRAEWGAPLALAGGALLSAAKPQLSFLFLLALGLTTLYVWEPRRWKRALCLTLAVVVPALLWQGGAYLANVFAIAERGSIMDVSLLAALNRLALPALPIAVAWGGVLGVTGWALWRTRGGRALPQPFARERAGLLIAAALLLSPYSAGNSLLTLLAVGVMPLFLRRPLWGVLLLIPVNLPVLFNTAAALPVQAYYTTATLVWCWGVLLADTLRGGSARGG